MKYVPGQDGFVTLYYDGKRKTHCVNETLYTLRGEFYADVKDAPELLKLDGVTENAVESDHTTTD